MPQILKEHMHNFGTDPDGNDLMKSEVIFGHPAVAEGCVAWSERNEKGAIFTKETQWGLTLKFVANGSEPHAQLILNTAKLAAFLGKIGPCVALCLIEWGISLTGPHNVGTDATQGPLMEAAIHLGQGENQANLYRFSPDEEHLDEDFLLGAINLSDKGFVFYSLEELEETISPEEEEVVQQEEKQEEEEGGIYCAEYDAVMMMEG